MTDLNRYKVPLGVRPALIVVDMTYGFTDPECALGTACETAITANQRLAQEFRSRQLPVYLTKVVFDQAQMQHPFAKRLPAIGLLAPNTRWTEIVAELGPWTDSELVEKAMPSAFFDTDLRSRLRLANADSLVVTGVSTSGCVRATAVDGLQYGYPVWVAREACADRNQSAHEANLFDLHAKYAEVSDVNTVVQHVRQL